MPEGWDRGLRRAGETRARLLPGDRPGPPHRRQPGIGPLPRPNPFGLNASYDDIRPAPWLVFAQAHRRCSPQGPPRRRRQRQLQPLPRPGGFPGPSAASHQNARQSALASRRSSQWSAVRPPGAPSGSSRLSWSPPKELRTGGSSATWRTTAGAPAKASAKRFPGVRRLTRERPPERISQPEELAVVWGEARPPPPRILAAFLESLRSEGRSSATWRWPQAPLGEVDLLLGQGWPGPSAPHTRTPTSSRISHPEGS
jgi:hypothetical protein